MASLLPVHAVSNCPRRTLLVIFGVAITIISACTPMSARTPPPSPAIPFPTGTATTKSPAEVYDTLRSGVVRVQSAGCPEIGSGTGFFIGDGFVVTAAHVVNQASSISIRGDGGAARATLIGVDWLRDVALLRVGMPISGPRLKGAVLAWSGTPAIVGQRVDALGYPLGLPLTREPGDITATDAQSDAGGVKRMGLITYNARAQPGNSGGPLVDDTTGDVVGLVDSGREQTQINEAISAEIAAPLVSAWLASPHPQQPADCDSSDYGQVTIKSKHPEARALAASLNALFAHENGGNLDMAAQWVTQDSKIRLYGDRTFIAVTLDSAKVDSNITDTANIRYSVMPGTSDQSRQCERHHSEFTLSLINGFWQAESERDLDPPTDCDLVDSTPTTPPNATQSLPAFPTGAP